MLPDLAPDVLGLKRLLEELVLFNDIHGQQRQIIEKSCMCKNGRRVNRI
jgi:hypothetical protein